MKLINIKSRRGFVNLFADFIVSHLDSNNILSQIQVTDCQNFIVVGGKSEYEDILDISKVKDKFISQFGDIYKSVGLEKLNIIDLIEYQKSPDIPKSNFFGDYYNTSRPIYNDSQIMAELKDKSYIDLDSSVREISTNLRSNYAISYEPYHISSEFPYGFSINNLRNKLYYMEYVSLNLFSIQGMTKTRFVWDENDIILRADSFIEEEHIESIMKDVFDFDLLSFNTKIKEYNILEDIINPKSEKPWLLKDKVNELYII